MSSPTPTLNIHDIVAAEVKAIVRELFNGAVNDSAPTTRRSSRRVVNGARKRGHLTAAARAHISAVQKKRWAEWRKAKAAKAKSRKSK